MTTGFDGIRTDWWINGLGPYDGHNERHLLMVLAMTGIPATYLDVGSGTGAMVNVARKLGIEAYGVDQLPRPEGWLSQHDLRYPLQLGRRFDLVTCIEVMEHIPVEYEGVACDSVASHVAEGGILVLTTALPGQAGAGHVTLQAPVHWRAQMYNRGLTYVPSLTLRLSLLWSNMHSPMAYLAANLQVFSNNTPRLASGVD